MLLFWAGVLLVTASFCLNGYLAYVNDYNYEAAEEWKLEAEYAYSEEPEPVPCTPNTVVSQVNLFANTSCSVEEENFDKFTLVTNICYKNNQAFIRQRMLENWVTTIDDAAFEQMLTDHRNRMLKNALYVPGGIRIALYESSLERRGGQITIFYKKEGDAIGPT